MSTIAKSVLWPSARNIVVRACFLYVGQGSCIVLLVRDKSKSTYRILVVDSNLDETNGGIDVPEFIKALSPDGHIYAYVNTHPHDDHLKGIKEISEAVIIDNVWHSGHKPSKKYGNYHPDLKAVMKDVEKRNGPSAVLELDASREEKPLFDASYYVLAPADHVNDDVNDEDPDARYRRIHENCSVLRVGKAPGWVLITGDADLVAFRDHITNYHRSRLPAFLLDASHHGSRSFFMKDEEDEPYLDALKAINPEYVVISAPTAEESRHEHPHDVAVSLYAAHVGAENVLHTGADRESFFFDIYEDGSHSGPQSDKGRLTEAYGLDREDDGNGGGGGGTRKSAGPFVRPTRPGEVAPRKYA